MNQSQFIEFPSLTRPPKADFPFVCFVMTPADPYKVRVRYEPSKGRRPARFRCDDHGDDLRELCTHAHAAATYMRGH